MQHLPWFKCTLEVEFCERWEKVCRPSHSFWGNFDTAVHVGTWSTSESLEVGANCRERAWPLTSAHWLIAATVCLTVSVRAWVFCILFSSILFYLSPIPQKTCSSYVFLMPVKTNPVKYRKKNTEKTESKGRAHAEKNISQVNFFLLFLMKFAVWERRRLFLLWEWAAKRHRRAAVFQPVHGKQNLFVYLRRHQETFREIWLKWMQFCFKGTHKKSRHFGSNNQDVVLMFLDCFISHHSMKTVDVFQQTVLKHLHFGL